MEQAFYPCPSLQKVSTTDAPRLDSVKSMAQMFREASSFNDTINHWDVSSVTDMSFMFASTDSFNQPINDWDVSSVTDMSYMFSAYQPPLSSGGGYTDKSAFNSSIDGWDASLVTTMHRMFYKNDTFNQAINNWDVSSVEDMSEMFHEAETFNQPIDNWDVSSVKNMEWMFRYARSFNQPLNNWNVSSVTSMQAMFVYAINFNQPLDKWNVSSVINMLGVFHKAYAFNQNLMRWNIRKVNNMYGIFDSTAISTANYDSTLISWQLKSHQSNVGFGADGLTYCVSDSARNLLIQDGWAFSGDSKNCTLVGINEKYKKQALFELYPNPSAGFVFLEISDNKRQFPLQIYNTNGSLLREIRLDQTQNRIDLSEFSDGLYLFRYGKNSEKVLLKR